MKEKYVCDLCGKTHYELDGYVKCVVECGEKLKKLEEEEKNKKYLEEVNAAINGVKQAKAYYEQKLNEFKEKYPAEYELNFMENVSCDNCGMFNCLEKCCMCYGDCSCCKNKCNCTDDDDTYEDCDECDCCDEEYDEDVEFDSCSKLNHDGCCMCQEDCNECLFCSDKCEYSNNKDNKMESMEFSYESNGKDKPKLSAKVNGIKVDNDHIEELFKNPEVNYFARVLGIL